MKKLPTEVTPELLIKQFGSVSFRDLLQTYLNSEVQNWNEIQKLCDSFATDISVERIGSIEETAGTIEADFTISFTDLQMAVCCEVQPGKAKTVSATIHLDRDTARSSLKIGVFWDTDNDGY